MPIVTKPNTFAANQIIDANQMNQNFDSIYGLVNGSLDAANLAANAINDSTKLANEIVIPSKSKGLIYASDLYGQNWVVAGGLATFSGSPVNQIQVNTVSANILQVDGTYRHVSVAATSYTTAALNSTYFLDLQPDGTMSWGITHSAQAGYLPLATVTTNGSGNVLAITDIRVLSAGIAWSNLSKSGSSLADLGTRSASDLNSGTLPVGRLPTAIPALSIGVGTVDNSEYACLDGVTGPIQTQLNSKGTISNGAGSPNGVVTPTIVGQLYTDTNTGLIYTATALTNTSWIIQAPYSGMTQQAIINAAMEVWQTGTSFTNPANNAYTADMWVNLLTNNGTLPTTITHTQNALTSGELFNSKYSYQVNVNGSGSGFGASDAYGQAQRIEFGTSKLCGNGKKVTISFYAKTSIASKRIAVGLKQVYGTGGSPSSTEILTPSTTTIRTITSSMALYTFTFTTNTLTGKTFGTNNDDYLEMCIYEMWGATFAANNLGGGTAETFVGSGNINFTQVVLNAGDQAFLFQPKTYQQELLDCMRHLWVPLANTSATRMSAYNANLMTFSMFLPTQMRITPAIRGAANIDIQVNTTSVSAQTGFSFTTTLLATCVQINATKTAHGLTDSFISMSSSSGFDARL